jgi:hypothetical protein
MGNVQVNRNPTEHPVVAAAVWADEMSDLMEHGMLSKSAWTEPDPDAEQPCFAVNTRHATIEPQAWRLAMEMPKSILRPAPFAPAPGLCVERKKFFGKRMLQWYELGTVLRRDNRRLPGVGCMALGIRSLHIPARHMMAATIASSSAIHSHLRAALPVSLADSGCGELVSE